MKELEDRVAMISGASKGLGAALARRFAREGAAVSLCARGGDDLRRIEAEVRELGAGCVAVETDVTDRAGVERWVAATLEGLGRVDVLVNNASILGQRVTIEAFDDDVWRRTIEVNLTGPFLCIRAALPALRGSRGSIVNISSGVGDHGRPRWGAYCVSKNGLEALTEILAGELDGSGVRVNTVDPGAMRTEMRAAAYPEEDPGTVATPDEVTDVFVYLASERSRDVNGERFRAQEFEVARR
ncbi:MAG: SDR family oxidoreductase [Candidatus Palauibacterales bacterium]|nr:SDR family oxidoreductase [Candidatus Palauibacterales bacterium]MDP2529927.1 SDR family oxidoreductase [Candidatus Palauibacterales bacterium]MDP2583347.1 SDR family oxidoreductase [Candidatus Palauibacterales bacterium]